MTTDQIKECYDWTMVEKQTASPKIVDRSRSSFEATETRGDDCGDKQEIIKTVPERTDLERLNKFYASIRTMRSPESIHASRMLEINKWRERGVVERWSREAAMAAGGQMFNARWVDEQHKVVKIRGQGRREDA